MSTFKTRVENWVGTITDTTALDIWLSNAVKWLISILPVDLLEQHAVDLTDTAGSSATFTVTLNGGGVTAVPIVGGGTGYPPYVDLVITHATGVGAKAYAVSNASGVITYTYVTAAGTGYATTAASATVDGSSGVTTSGHRIIGAHRSGYPAKFIASTQKAFYADANSMYYATAKFPIAYLEKEKGYVLPGGGILCGVPYTAVSNGDTAITNFPDQLDPAVVLYAAIQRRVQQIQAASIIAGNLSWVPPIQPSVPADASYSYTDAVVGTIASTSIAPLSTPPTFTAPSITGWPIAIIPLSVSGLTPPTVPTAPSYSYTDTVIGTVAGTTIDALGTAPVYTAPTVTLPVTPGALDTSAITPPAVPSAPGYSYTDAVVGTIAATTIEALGTAPVFIKPSIVAVAIPDAFDLSSVTAPTVPTAPAYAYSDAAVGSIAATTITALGTPPAFIKPTISAWSTSPTEPDWVGLAITAPTPPAVPTYTFIDALGTAISSTSIAALPTPPAYVAPAVPVAFSNAITAITTNEDIELGEAELLIVQTELAKYKVDIENALNDFNEARVLYEAGVQRNLEQARLDQQRLIEVAHLATDLALKNSIEGAAARVHYYQLALELFDGELKLYIEETERNIKIYVANINNVQMSRSTSVQRFSADIENAWHDFEKDNVPYQAAIQHAIEQARLDQARLTQVAQLTTDVNLRNEQQTAVTEIALYQAVLEKFQGDLKRYTDQTQSAVAQYQANATRYQVTRASALQQYATDIENEWHSFEKLNVPYQAAIQRAIEQARLDQARLSAVAQMTTDLNLRNEQQTTVADIASYQATLEKFQGDLKRYTDQIDTIIKVYQGNTTRWIADRDSLLRKYTTDVESGFHSFEKENVEYQATLQRSIEQARLDATRLLKVMEITTDANLKNAQQTTAIAVALYQAVLEKFQGDLKHYVDQVDAAVHVFQSNVASFQADRQTLVAKYQADIENAVKEFEKENVEYQTKLQYAVAQAKLDSDRLTTVAQMTTDLNLRNAQQTAAVSIALSGVLLDAFGHHVTKFQTEVTAEAQRIQAMILRSAEDCKELTASCNELRKELQTFLMPYIKSSEEKQNG